MALSWRCGHRRQPQDQHDAATTPATLWPTTARTVLTGDCLPRVQRGVCEAQKTQQLATLASLPVIKIAMKNIVAHVATDVQDLMPQIVLFSVELFHTLYVVTCPQTVGSLQASLAVTAADAVNLCRTMRNIHMQMSAVQRIHRHALVQLPPTPLTDDSRSLLAPVQRIYAASHGHITASKMMRLRTIPRYQLGVDARGLLALLATGPPQAASSVSRLSFHRAVYPLTLGDSTRQDSIKQQEGRTAPSDMDAIIQCIPSEQRQELVQRTLQMLFRCEYLVLTEFIECAMPLVYSTYLAALYHLPDARFFPYTRCMTDDEFAATVTTALLYAALEGLSLILLHVMLRHKFRVSSLHQLAFVLETQCGLIQSVVFVWVPVILQYELDHTWFDFTFKFDYARLEGAARNGTLGGD